MFSSLAIAAPKLDENKIDKKLLEIGVPQKILNEMSIDYKADVAESAIEYLGTEKQSLIESKTDDNKTEIVPMGQINESDMDFYIDIYKTDNSSDDRERILVYTRYNWKNGEPDWTLTDIVATAWEEDLWRAVDDSWKWTYSRLKFTGDVKTKKGYECGDIKKSGIYFYIDILSDASSHWGYTKVTLESRQTGPISGSDEIHAKYVHNIVGGSIGVVFSGVNINVTGSQTFDERGAQETFSY